MPPPSAGPPSKPSPFAGLGGMWSQRKQVWALASRRDKIGLVLATIISAVTSKLDVTISVRLGLLTTGALSLAGKPPGELLHFAGWALAWLAGAYVLRESLGMLAR